MSKNTPSLSPEELKDSYECTHVLVTKFSEGGECSCNVSCVCRKYPACKPRKRKTNRERITGSSASIQTVGTPDWLVKSIELTWQQQVTLDAAADAENHVCECYLTKEVDALSFPSWRASGLIFFNPPFKMIGKFCAKAVESAEVGQHVIGLVLASVGSKWWRDFVDGQADVYFINRIHFKGHATCFMKDLAVLSYSPESLKFGGSYQCARLKEGEIQDIIEATSGS